MVKAGFLFGLKVLMIFIFATWVSVWILKPTRLWTRKWKQAEDFARPTIFGYYGLNFAVYTFPIIVLAMIGYVYLTLKPRWPKHRQVRITKATISNPLIIKNPLGVLSCLEILAITTFIVFLAWTFYTRISNDFIKIKPDKSLNLSLWQYKYLRVASRFGLLAEACLALLLLPVLRGMSLFRLVGVQFEASVRYHVWLGTSMIFFATFHGVSTLFIWGINHRIQDQMWKWQKTGRIYLAGEITLITGLVIFITSLPAIRRKQFEIFFFTHHLYIVFLVFFLFHTGDRHFYMVFPGVFLFGIEKLLCILQSRPVTCILSAKIYPCKVIELSIPKDPGLKYTPTSVIFMKIPSISKFQWHPFSVTSSSVKDDQTISVIIKCEGGWTDSLYNMICAEVDSTYDCMKCIPVAIEGPYGPPSLEFLRYDTLLLVAGGIGITPFLSILEELSTTKGINRSTNPTKVQLIFIAKTFQDISLLNPISHLLSNEPPKNWHLKLKFFTTQEPPSNLTIKELLQEFSCMKTVEFDTKGSNCAIHGIDSLLLMAAMTGFSSIIFLVSLSFLNHVFFPVVKKGAKQKNPSSLSDLFLICSFILAIVCSILVAGIVRWGKLNTDNVLVLPRASQKHEKDHKLSLFQSRNNSQLEEHEIHFGGRPNFEGILLDFANENEGSNTGLLVCGPASMNESVALSCRQHSQAQNIEALKNKNTKKKKTCFNFRSHNFTL